MANNYIDYSTMFRFHLDTDDLINEVALDQSMLFGSSHDFKTLCLVELQCLFVVSPDGCDHRARSAAFFPRACRDRGAEA